MPLSCPLCGGRGRILKASCSLRSPAILAAVLLCSAMNSVYSLIPAPCWVGWSKEDPFAPNLWAEKQLSKSNHKSKVTHRVVKIVFELATLPVHQRRSCVLTSFKGKKKVLSKVYWKPEGRGAWVGKGALGRVCCWRAEGGKLWRGRT